MIHENPVDMMFPQTLAPRLPTMQIMRSGGLKTVTSILPTGGGGAPLLHLPLTDLNTEHKFTQLTHLFQHEQEKIQTFIHKIKPIK